MTALFYRYARPYGRHYAGGLVLLLVTNALALLVPWLLRDAIDGMERGEALAFVAWHAGAMALVALAQAAVRTWSRLAILGASRRVVYDIRRAFFAQLQRLGASFYDTHRTGDLMSRGVNDLQLLRSFYGPGALNLLNTAIVYVGVITLLVSIDPVLTLYALALLPPLFLGVKMISARVYLRSLAVQEQLSLVSSKTQENLSGIQQVRIFAQEEREIGAFRALGQEFRLRNLAMVRLRGWMLALIGIVTGAETLVVLFAGGQHVVAGRISLGEFVAFNAYLAQLAWPTVALGWIINVFQRGAGAMERVQEILAIEPDVPAADAAGAALASGTAEETAASNEPPLEGDLEIRALTFAYPGAVARTARGAPRASASPSSRPVLRDVSLTIARGSRVAIVGGVGSGKSTLVNLIARVYEAPPGTIFIGGEDITAVPTARVRASIGYAPQEAFLFSRTLAENIRFGAPEASDDDLARAVALARLDGEIARFPEGLQAMVGERGYTLSGGQRQRATLARAALRRPRLLILDDSLSAVDADTEQAILRGLDELMEGRTTLVITHRPAVLQQVDRIVVLEAGRVVEDGSHDELLGARGVYARLFHEHELHERLGRS